MHAHITFMRAHAHTPKNVIKLKGLTEIMSVLHYYIMAGQGSFNLILFIQVGKGMGDKREDSAQDKLCISPSLEHQRKVS